MASNPHSATASLDDKLPLPEPANFHDKSEATTLKEDSDSISIASDAFPAKNRPNHDGQSLSHHPTLPHQPLTAFEKSNILNPEADSPEEDTTEDIVRRRTTMGEDPFFVEWDDRRDEFENPRNWSKGRKWWVTILGSFLVLNATFASSAPSGATLSIMKSFHSSEEVTTLVTSLFVAGYIVGPLFWAPLGEIYGRRPIFIISLSLYTILNIPAALSPNIAFLIAFRFLTGMFAAAPLTNSGGVVADIWTPMEIGTPLALFSLSPFLGPCIGPIVGGFVSLSKPAFSPWRYIFYLQTLCGGIFTLLVFFTLPETYGPQLLVRKARLIREKTGDNRYYAKEERREGGVFKVALTRPWKMLFNEPIVALICLYLAIVYGIVYLLFEAFPIVFQGVHGMNAGVGSLPFISIGVGAFLAVVSSAPFNRRYLAAYLRNNNQPVPEERLPGTIFGSISLVIGLFWFSWTGYRADIHWIFPSLAGVLLGFGILWSFMGFLSYLADCYKWFTASAYCASTVTRSIFGAAFPLFTAQMYNGLGIQWAGTLLGCLALLLAPSPWLFYRYGKQIRSRSKFAF